MPPSVTCAWCERPATGEVVTRAARFAMRKGEKVLTEREQTAPACAEHSTVQRTPPDPLKRRRRIGREQTTIFDMGL